MKKPVITLATAVPCPDCGGVLTWAADDWLAAHEQVFRCEGCGRLHPGKPTLREIGPMKRAAERQQRSLETRR
jgi:predicted RNA-binding Zn-ribbon protein involved in translation (DUF1610 family)